MADDEVNGSTMTAAWFLGTLRSGLVGHKITFCRLAVYYLLLYADCEPGDQTGVTMWLNPPWRVVGPDGVLVHSDEIDEDEEDLDPYSDRLLPLVGRVIEDIAIEDGTFRLTASFDGEHLVETCHHEDPGDELWHLRQNSTGVRLCATPGGLVVHRGG